MEAHIKHLNFFYSVSLSDSLTDRYSARHPASGTDTSWGTCKNRYTDRLMDRWVTDKKTICQWAISTNTHKNWPNVIQIEGTNSNSVEKAYRKTGKTDEWKDWHKCWQIILGIRLKDDC